MSTVGPPQAKERRERIQATLPVKDEPVVEVIESFEVGAVDDENERESRGQRRQPSGAGDRVDGKGHATEGRGAKQDGPIEGVQSDE